jgi:hypothetical protein
MRRKLMTAILGACVVFGAGFAIGQQNARTPALEEFMAAQVKTRFGGSAEDYGNLARLYMEAPRHSEVVQQVVRQLSSRGATAPELQGQALIIAQNQRIIELLEQQSKDK